MLAVLKNSRGKYTSSYWLSSKNILSVFKAFDLTLHTTRSNSGRLAYNRTIIVEKGLSADLVVKTIMDRKNEFSDMDTDFGFAVVNTDPSTKSGYHWVIVVFQREHIDIKLCVYDPLDNTDACYQILAATSNDFTIDVCATALSWQDDGWRCGYYCVYAIIVSSFVVDKEELNAMLTEGQRVLKKMPKGFESVIWCILQIVDEAASKNCDCNSFFKQGVATHLSELVGYSERTEFDTFVKNVYEGWESYLCANQ